jgi:hypothetical protein
MKPEQAIKDDILPLSKPIVLPNGRKTDRIVVAKGTRTILSTPLINCSRSIWGEDSWEFRPDRWLEGLPHATETISGYRHLLTFLDGPKTYVAYNEII